MVTYNSKIYRICQSNYSPRPVHKKYGKKLGNIKQN